MCICFCTVRFDFYKELTVAVLMVLLGVLVFEM